ncbi:MAG: HAMP domain-containing histidine kinase [Lachnospiraceae bacterium]|nr:HAMP domain-containing histidine kinase [Ruminococcus sp.]MCM1277128.1 HAMP domain-containing histidine kinase [Lachnospiraceae bacterium]
MRKIDEKQLRRALRAITGFLSFFLLMSFVISCCMVLFLTIMQSSMNIELQQSEIQQAAKLTFANVILLSLLCAVIDEIRRHIMVDRPVKKIVHASQKIMGGDFSVRVEKIRSVDPTDGFNVIIDYFNKMVEELSGLETLRTDFIANVSHELKTPLAVIQNYVTILQQTGLSDEKRIEIAKTISDSTRKLSDLITNILKLNKLENQQIFPEKHVFNLGEQLCECLLNFENVWEQKNIEIETDIEENVFVETDSELLSLVWNNLFSNAFKFTDTDGCVSLSLKSDIEFAIVRVSDTGCGIDKETGTHIFEKFYQGDTSHSTQGNGLGLALVKRIVDITEGDISVESELGNGSTFTIKLRKRGTDNDKVRIDP